MTFAEHGVPEHVFRFLPPRHFINGERGEPTSYAFASWQYYRPASASPIRLWPLDTAVCCVLVLREGLHRWCLPRPLALAIPYCVAHFTNLCLLTVPAQAKTMQRLAPEVIASLAQAELARGGGGDGGGMLPAERRRVDEREREAALLQARQQPQGPQAQARFQAAQQARFEEDSRRQGDAGLTASQAQAQFEEEIRQRSEAGLTRSQEQARFEEESLRRQGEAGLMGSQAQAQFEEEIRRRGEARPRGYGEVGLMGLQAPLSLAAESRAVQQRARAATEWAAVQQQGEVPARRQEAVRAERSGSERLRQEAVRARERLRQEQMRAELSERERRWSREAQGASGAGLIRMARPPPRWQVGTRAYRLPRHRQAL